MVAPLRFGKAFFTDGGWLLTILGVGITTWILAFVLLRAEFYFQSSSFSGDLLLHGGSSLKAELIKIVSGLPDAVNLPAIPHPLAPVMS